MGLENKNFDLSIPGLSTNGISPAPVQAPGASAPFLVTPTPLKTPSAAASLEELLANPAFQTPTPAPPDAASHNFLKAGKTMFTTSLFFALAVYGFFATQMNPDFTLQDGLFGPNRAARFESSNFELQKKQTELNLLKFKTARLLLNRVNLEFDGYMQQQNILSSPIATSAQKFSAAAEKNRAAVQIREDLTAVQKIFSEPLGVDTYSREPVSLEEREAAFENILTAKLGRDRSALDTGGAETSGELAILNDLAALVANKTLRKAITAPDFTKISDDELEKLLRLLRASRSDQFALLEKLRGRRLDWANVIADIHDVTRQVDQLYGQGLFKTSGGFLFTGYTFDAKAGRISVSGMTRRSDPKVFTAITQLVSAIEKSPKFQDIDFRTFTKNKEEGGDYSSSLNLGFSLQPADASDSRDETLPQSTP